MENKMQSTFLGYIGTTIRIPSFLAIQRLVRYLLGLAPRLHNHEAESER